jgi:hypothetical protein
MLPDLHASQLSLSAQIERSSAIGEILKIRQSDGRHAPTV